MTVEALFTEKGVIAEALPKAKEYYDKSRWGEIKRNKILYSFVEALFLLESNKMTIKDGRNKALSPEAFLKKAKKYDKNISVRYPVFKDLRKRGYIVKTALKFGADFRVYDKGVKPGEDHAKWIVFPVYEAEMLTWYEFSAKNRVSHSTKKKLLMAVVDDEDDVTYYEVSWLRP